MTIPKISIMIGYAALLLTGCTANVELEESVAPSAKRLSVPLRPAYSQYMEQQAAREKKLKVEAASQPQCLPEWSRAVEREDFRSLDLPHTRVEARIPKEWQVSTKIPEKVGYYYLCRGVERKDLSAPVMMIAVVETQGGEPEVSKGLNDALKGIQLSRPNWEHSRPEWGSIGGHPFLRAYWRGEDASGAISMASGVTYAAVVRTSRGRNALLVMSVQDLQKYSKTTIPDGEQAILASVVADHRILTTLNKGKVI